MMNRTDIPPRSWRKDGSLLAISFLLGLVAATLCGCTTTDQMMMSMGISEKPDQVEGVIAPYERIEALERLQKSGPKSTDEVQQGVSSQLVTEYRDEADPMIRSQIIKTLGAYPTEASATVLRHALTDPDPEVRMVACEAWGKRGDMEAIQRLGELIKVDTDSDVRIAAVRALGETRRAEAVQSIAPALEDSNPALQRRAVLAMKEVSNQDFGNDVVRWHQWATNKQVEPPQKTSFAEKVKGIFR